MIEICCFSLEDALHARSAGVKRIELCSGYEAGGTTPNMGRLHLVRNLKGMDVHVMIRPRGGNFIYSEYELEEMIFDILTVKEMGLSGVVLGLLDENNLVQVNQLKHLVQVAGHMEVTFHRAFDLTDDPFLSLDQIASCGVKRILTSGKAATAMQGLPLLKDLVNHAGSRIEIMAGGGVNPDNLIMLHAAGIRHFHASCARKYHKTSVKKTNINFNQEGLQQHEQFETDGGKIRSLLSQLALLNAKNEN